MIGRGKGVAVIDAAREHGFQNDAGRCDLAVNRLRRILLLALRSAALALPAASVFAQSSLSPKISLQGDQKRPLRRKSKNGQKRLDAEYKAATSRFPIRTRRSFGRCAPSAVRFGVEEEAT